MRQLSMVSVGELKTCTRQWYFSRSKEFYCVDT